MDSAVRDMLARFDRSFVAGDAEAFVALFAEDALVMPNNEPSVSGRAAIRDGFADLFADMDTSDYRSQYQTVVVHATEAYVIGDVTEVLRPRDGSAGVRVQARVVLFLRQVGGEWRISHMLTSRSAPDQRLT